MFIMYAVFKYSKSANIGDDIMTIAVVNMLAEYGVKPTFYIDRDTGAITHYKKSLSGISMDSPMSLVLYGWHDGGYTAWPLPQAVTRVLVIGLHVNEVPKDESYDWLAKCDNPKSIFSDMKLLSGKIGLRDMHSYALAVTAARRQGVRAEVYFSGCVTMTLKRCEEHKRSGVYLVDVYKKALEGKVPSELLDSAVPISHFYTGDVTLPGTHKVKNAMAKQLLEIYSSASLVITSRLHCLIPCLALGTPVLFYPYKVDLSDVRLSDYIATVPVIGRDIIDYSDIKNILPPGWDSRVKYMRNELREWIIG